jgi:hypothetical protein
VTSLVEAAGGIKEATSRCRVQAATLFRYTDDSEENADRHMPVDIVEALEQQSGLPVVTEYLAERSGCLLLPKPAEDAESALSIDILETGDAVSLLFRDWAEFIGNDGVIDLGEAQKLLKDNIKLVRILLRMRMDLEARILELSPATGLKLANSIQGRRT